MTMIDNPYKPPRVTLEETYTAPPRISKKIQYATVAGGILGTLTLILTCVSLFGVSIPNVSVWSLIDAGLVFGLTFGVYNKSRVCAILLFSYYVVSKIQYSIITQKVDGIAYSLIFTIFFVVGIVGTFEFHSDRKKSALKDSNPEPTRVGKKYVSEHLSLNVFENKIQRIGSQLEGHSSLMFRTSINGYERKFFVNSDHDLTEGLEINETFSDSHLSIKIAGVSDFTVKVQIDFRGTENFLLEEDLKLESSNSVST
jgi:serine/threonine-protein kinase